MALITRTSALRMDSAKQAVRALSGRSNANRMNLSKCLYFRARSDGSPLR
jgi:hypothetical protein